MTDPVDLSREEDVNALYKHIIDELGRESQVDNVIEEAAELIFAVCKHKRRAAAGEPGGPELDAVIEEIVDLQIALDQAKLIYLGPSPEAALAFADLKRRKLGRLVERAALAGKLDAR